MKYHALLIVLLTVPLMLLAGCSDNESEPPATPLSGTAVDWQTWSRGSFDKARAADKLVFLYLEPFWCEPCLTMKRNTFTDPEIAQLLSKNFVSIYANSEKNPSLYERYQLGTYPSCVILTSSAGMIGGSNALSPDSLKVLLSRILDVKKSQPEAIEAQASRLEQRFRESAGKILPGRPSEEIVTNTEHAVLSLYDSLYYGFGNQPKYLMPKALEFMMAAVSPEGLAFESELKNTLDAQLALYDTVWGGFGRSARFADWSEVNCEKLLELNAEMAMLYLDACQIMDEPRYCRIAEGVIGYIDRFLTTEQGWGFYNSQRGVLLSGTEKVTDQDTYFSLSENERLDLGIPEIDSTVFAGATARALSSYLRVARAVDSSGWIQYALASLDTLVGNFIGASGRVPHQLVPHAEHPSGLLPDQIAVANALIDAYETTGDERYLREAEKVAAFITSKLEDMKLGGLMFEPPIENPIGREYIRIKPYVPNAEAVWTFTRLYYLTADSKYQRPAESTLRYVIAKPVNQVDVRLPYLGMAYLNLTRYPTLLTLIGENDDDYHQLLSQLWQEYYPRRIVVHLGKADETQTHGELTFPVSARPQMFACGFDTLSTAIFKPENVHEEISRFLRAYR